MSGPPQHNGNRKRVFVNVDSNAARQLTPDNGWRLPPTAIRAPVPQRPLVPVQGTEMDEDDLDDYYNARDEIQQHYFNTVNKGKGVHLGAPDEDVPRHKQEDSLKANHLKHKRGVAGTKSIRPEIDHKLMRQSKELIERDEIWEDTTEEREALRLKNLPNPKEIVEFKQKFVAKIEEHKQFVRTQPWFQAKDGKSKQERKVCNDTTTLPNCVSRFWCMRPRTCSPPRRIG